MIKKCKICNKIMQVIVSQKVAVGYDYGACQKCNLEATP